MKLKKDTKFGEESTSRFKIDIRNFTNFDLSAWKSQKFSFYWPPFEESTYCLSWKTIGELYSMKLKRDTKSGAESTYSVKNGITNLTIFNPSARKSEEFSF